jgi:hypothetical protein
MEFLNINKILWEVNQEEQKEVTNKKQMKSMKGGYKSKKNIINGIKKFDVIDSLQIAESNDEDTERFEEKKDIKNTILSIEDQIKYSCLAGKSWDEFSHTFTCSIWLKIFPERQHLSWVDCSNTFWKKCILDSLSTSKKNIDLQKCPMCRKDTTPDRFKFNVMVDRVLHTINEGFNSFRGFDIWYDHKQKAFGFWRDCKTVCCQNCQFKGAKHDCHEIIDLTKKFQSYKEHHSSIINLIEEAMSRLQKEIDCGNDVSQKSLDISINIWRTIQGKLNEFIDNKIEEMKTRFEETYESTLEAWKNIVYDLKQKKNEFPVKIWPREVENWRINSSDFHFLKDQKASFTHLKSNMTESNYFWDPCLPVSAEISFDLQAILSKQEQIVLTDFGSLKQFYDEGTKQVTITISYNKKEEKKSYLGSTTKYQAVAELPQLSQTYIRKYKKSEELEEGKEKCLLTVSYKRIKDQSKGKNWGAFNLSIKLFKYHLHDEFNILKELKTFIKSIKF